MRKTSLVILMCLMSAAVFAQQGVLRDVAGTVEIKYPGQPDFTPAKAGDEVPGKAIIATGFKSTAVIAVGNSLITIRPITRLSLEELVQSQNTETIDMQLQTGRIRVEVKPPAGTKSNFTVSSPMATASVRGTEFEFDMLNVSVSEGTVEYNGARGGSVLVDGGNNSRVDTGNGSAADPLDTAGAALLPPSPSGVEETGPESTSPNLTVPHTAFNFVFEK
ncbi:iron dicitrate transporter FecR [Spirochaetia bacterium]|nr:iron dicitrate transporter FecR [Spirochaetia bacterium]